MDPITFTFPGFKKIFSDGWNLFEKTAPLSTDCVIAFPFTSNKKFSRTIYSQEMTQGRASSEDINQALTLLEIGYSRLPTKFSLFKSIASRYLLPFIMLFWIYCEFILHFYYNGYYYRYQTFVIMWVFFTIYCIAGSCYQVYDRKRQLKQAETELEDILKMTQAGYLKRGLRWRIPDDSYGWIELIKEYRVEDGVQETDEAKSQYVPPENVVDQEVKTS